jgi:hypothetical protein
MLDMKISSLILCLCLCKYIFKIAQRCKVINLNKREKMSIQQQSFQNYRQSITDKFNNFSQKHPTLNMGFDALSGAGMYAGTLVLGTSLGEPALIAASKVIFAATLFTGAILPGFIAKQSIAASYACAKTVQNGFVNKMC